MRHQCRVPLLGRPADQRKAMLRGLTTQLIREGRVTTTKARAKALRDEAERMISLAKDGSLSARRRAIGYIYDKQLVHALFDKAQDRYGDRNGGYTRIIRTVPRRGDNAEMAIIELSEPNHGPSRPRQLCRTLVPGQRSDPTDRPLPPVRGFRFSWLAAPAPSDQRAGGAGSGAL